MTFLTRLFVILIMVAPVNQRIQAQKSAGDNITGIWISEAKDGKIEIFKTGNTYSGRLLWGKYVYDEHGNPRHDINNPDPKLRSQLLKGMIILKGLVYKDREWDDGTIYDPISSRTYDVTVTLKGADLALRGYVGISFFGKTTIWKRMGGK